jgi:hypothetical protein
MDELEVKQNRLAKARERLRELPQIGPGNPGAPDPETGEAWNRSNVLGHVAEMVPFWTGQVKSVLDGAAVTGRGESGYALRREAIDAGPAVDEAELRARIETALDDLTATLNGMQAADLKRPIHHHANKAEHDTDLGWLVEDMLVAHFEAHVRQLEELS